jgi:hypothetical protein
MPKVIALTFEPSHTCIGSDRDSQTDVESNEQSKMEDSQVLLFQNCLLVSAPVFVIGTEDMYSRMTSL